MALNIIPESERILVLHVKIPISNILLTLSAAERATRYVRKIKMSSEIGTIFYRKVQRLTMEILHGPH